ncbi:MAG: hypothetical protein ACKOXB_05870 [Flavobacteriales bacterium]
MEYLNKNSKTIALICIIIAVLWILLGPYIITRISIFPGFSDTSHNTGIIGDTIGGITAPVIGLISALLLYLALIKQIENNEIAKKSLEHSLQESNFKLIFEEIKSFGKEIDSFSFKSVTGSKGIDYFCRYIPETFNQNEATKVIYYQKAQEFDQLLNSFDRIIYLSEWFDISAKHKDIIFKDVQLILIKNFNKAYQEHITSWPVSEDDIKSDLLKGLLYSIKNHIETLDKKISSNSISH